MCHIHDDILLYKAEAAAAAAASKEAEFFLYKSIGDPYAIDRRIKITKIFVLRKENGTKLANQ